VSPPVSPRVITFLYEAVNFAVLAALLGWLFFKPAREALEQYRRRHEEALQNAEKIRADAERLRAEIDAQRASLNTELSRLRAEELASARRRGQEILTEAEALASRKQTDAMRRVRHLEEAQASQLGQAAAGAAASVVARLLERLDSPGLDSGLVRSACGELEKIPKASLSPVRIETARPLAPEDRAAIEAALSGVIPAPAYHVDDVLGAGIRIWTSQGLIDASIAGLSLHAEQALRSELNHQAAPSEAQSQT
jgi:F-type H+-transporting ATPase subunit b